MWFTIAPVRWKRKPEIYWWAQIHTILKLYRIYDIETNFGWLKDVKSEQTCGYFQWEQYKDRQPVKHVVDGGAGKRPPEVVTMRDLSQGHQSVGHRGSYVGTHNDGYGQLYREDCKDEEIYVEVSKNVVSKQM